MKLYTRAALGVIAAFVLTYAVLGVTKSHFIDPARRQAFFAIAEPALMDLAHGLRDAEARGASLDRIDVLWRGRVRLAELERSDAQGWFVRDGEMFAYARIHDGEYLLYGPFPELDPHHAVVSAIALGTPVLLAAVIAFIIVTPVVRRARSIAQTTERLAEGDLAARAAVPAGNDALTHLARRFNDMAVEIERLVCSKQELLQAVSHEFRTPSSRIRFELEMLGDADGEDERRRRIESIDDSLSELDELVDELLTYARFDSSEPDLAVEDVAPTDVATSLVEEIRAARPGVAIEVEAAPEVGFAANPRYFRRALRNLMLNGQRHAETLVRVGASMEGQRVVVWIEDDGPGIAADQRERVFEPFARLEGSRDREHGGAGLGLAIVRRICSWHGASVVVEDSKVGARFAMRWLPEPRPIKDPGISSSWRSA